jgi:hypothetical protein
MSFAQNVRQQNPYQTLVQKHGTFSISIFEIVGVYFVNKIFNDMHFWAIRQHDAGHAPSTTVAFIRALEHYSNFIQTEEDNFVSESLKGIRDTAVAREGSDEMVAGLPKIGMRDLTEAISKAVLPEEIYDTLGLEDKYKFIRHVLTTSVLALIRSMFNNNQSLIKVVIDLHDDGESPRILQDEYVICVCSVKDRLVSDFVSAQMPSSTQTIIDQGSMHDIYRQVAAVKQEYEKVAQAKKSLEKALTYKDEEIETLKDRISELESLVDELTAEKEVLSEETAAAIRARLEPNKKEDEEENEEDETLILDSEDTNRLIADVRKAMEDQGGVDSTIKTAPMRDIIRRKQDEDSDSDSDEDIIQEEEYDEGDFEDEDSDLDGADLMP